MGSDHYCLRWNNHQNNLLGVFSQLLQEESLVDVTLACSEGHSIRAHKVVLSACSTYFQTLFLDHPNRHPIVILKDVCFAELRTLIEFMYRGEVNVEYCQLSALLKTAQSLKVKGLSEMTHLRTSHSPEITDQASTAATETTSVISEPHSVISENPIALVHPSRSPDYERRNNILPASPSPVVVSPARSEYPCRMSPIDGSVSPIVVDDDRTRPSYINVASHTTTSHYSTTPNPSPNLLPVQEEPLSLKIKPEWDRASNSNSDQASSISKECLSLDTSLNRLKSWEMLYRIPDPHTVSLSNSIFGSTTPLSAIPNLSSGSSTPSFDQISVASSGSSTPFLFPPFPPFSMFPSPYLPFGELSLPRYYSILSQSLLHPFTSPSEHLKCGICKAGFPNLLLLNQHNRLQHSGQTTRRHQVSDSSEEKPFQCEQCGQSYRYRSAYVKHREQNHRARLPADKLFTCEICGMQFRYLKSFKKHRLNHTLERPNTSDGAGNDTQSETSQQPTVDGNVSESQVSSSNEIEVQSTERPSSRNGTEAVDSVAMTMPVGAGEPTLLNLLRFPTDTQRQRQMFTCSYCRKTVRSKENLKLHVRKHTGERPFACLFCGRAFGGKSDLTRHVRIHTGERPYHCEMCGKCFARADYLSKHLTTHIHHQPRVTTT